MYKILIILSILLYFIGCSPVSYETEQTVYYNEIVNTDWYVVGTRNNLEHFKFYEDSIIIYVYYYSPYKQYYKDYIYDKYEVMSIVKRKLEILEHDIPYQDGDGEWLMLQYYRGYTVGNNGENIKDNSQYDYIYCLGYNDSIMYLGLFDDLEDIQQSWTFYKNPPINIKFTNWN